MPQREEGAVPQAPQWKKVPQTSKHNELHNGAKDVDVSYPVALHSTLPAQFWCMTGNGGNSSPRGPEYICNTWQIRECHQSECQRH
eukprot:gene9972-biopygen18256